MVNAADTAWILISAALVMLMIPGLALFYGGMVRQKNYLSTIMMSMAPLGFIGILWVLYGYSLGFGPDLGGIIGKLDFIGLTNVGQEPSDVYATTVPHLAFMVFQAMFAVITVALWTGGVVERIKFSGFIALAVLWFTIVYCPVAHWVWGAGGWLGPDGLGALDFAGGAVVHINAGMSALAIAFLIGPRKGFKGGEPMEPHNISVVMLGTGILWFGWFGFNAGSALASGGQAASAFVATNISAASAALTWMILGWINRRPSALGTATGAVAGLVAITPAAGFVPPIAAIPIGVVASIICYYCIVLRTKKGVDESLDVWAVHGMGGVWGALATGIFASAAVGGADGLIHGDVAQFAKQVLSVLAVATFAFSVTWILGKIVNATIGLRVREDEEVVGLDISQHGERALGGISA